MFQGFRGAAKRLEDTDINRIGALIGVGEDEIHAIMEVESRGTGFDANGRLIMLYEPHWFYRLLGPGKARDKAVQAGLAYEKWRPGTYPKDSYPRLLEAMAIDEDKALSSCSWGLAQIMGFNHQVCGYPSVKAMIEHFAADEEHQLAAMVTFIKAKKLDDEIRSHNWILFARGYNGTGQEETYGRKLREAFRRWQAIRDTPWDPRKMPPMPDMPDLDVPPAQPSPPTADVPKPAPQSLTAENAALGLGKGAAAAFVAIGLALATAGKAAWEYVAPLLGMGGGS